VTRQQIAAVWAEARALDRRNRPSDDALQEAALYFLERTRGYALRGLTLSLFLEVARNRGRNTFNREVSAPVTPAGDAVSLAWWEAHEAEGVLRRSAKNNAE
jgi:hypothetical protein